MHLRNILHTVGNAYNRVSLGVVCSALAVSSAIAQEVSESTFDFEAAENAAKNLGDELSSFLTDHVVPAVLVVVAAFAGLLLVYRVVRWLFKAMTGR